MSDDQTTNAPMRPIILSMEADDDDSSESEYRLRIGNQVKYLVISPRIFDRDTLSFPIHSLPHLPYKEEWTVVHISRDETSGDLKNFISNQTLTDVRRQWRHTRVDFLELEKTGRLTAIASEAVSHSILPIIFLSLATIIAKITRFL